jgi:ring-1,2-phenylacetyl-CoA epoxidase subunit PaaD
MTDAGRRKLREYGIAPPMSAADPQPGPGPGYPTANAPGNTPGDTVSARLLRFLPPAAARADVPCPRCGSHDTTETSPFGSTACKAMYRCLACCEPFDYFKPH